jgi:hypothetical protein
MDIVTSSAHKCGERGNIHTVPTAIKQFPISFYKSGPLIRFPMISHKQTSSVSILFISNIPTDSARNFFIGSAVFLVCRCKISHYSAVLIYVLNLKYRLPFPRSFM